MAVNTGNQKKKFSQDHIQAMSFDEALQVAVRMSLGFDGANSQRMNADALATKITTSGTSTFIAIAPPGTSQSSASWQCKQLDSSVSGTISILWADGDANFDNVATDLTALTYS